MLVTRSETIIPNNIMYENKSLITVIVRVYTTIYIYIYMHYSKYINYIVYKVRFMSKRKFQGAFWISVITRTQLG